MRDIDRQQLAPGRRGRSNRKAFTAGPGACARNKDG